LSLAHADSKLTEAAKVEQTKAHHESYSSSHGCARGAAPRSQNLALGRAAVRAQPAQLLPACGRGSGAVCGPGSVPRPASRLRARLHPPDAAQCRGARSKKPRGPTKDEKNALAKAGAAVAAVAAVALGGYFIYKVRPAIPAAPSAANVVSEQRGGGRRTRRWCASVRLARAALKDSTAFADGDLLVRKRRT